MRNVKQIDTDFKEFERKIERLKQAGKQLDALNAPQEVFGAQVESLKKKLKSPALVEEVEHEISLLRERVGEHLHLYAAATKSKQAEPTARKAVESARAVLEQARGSGSQVLEPESLLGQAIAALAQKDYQSAIQLAERASLGARSAQQAGMPEILLELTERNFPPNAWKAVDVNIVNKGTAHARDLGITFSKEVETKLLKGITELKAGSKETLRIGVKPRDEGDIPLEATVTYKDLSGKPYSDTKTLWLKVRAGATDEVERPGAVMELPEYTIMEKLGSGGFADVFKAQRKDGTMLALKKPRLDPYTTFVPTDFLREAELWSKLSHPHIVKLFEYGAKPYPWMSMELMSGGSLRSRIGTLTLEDSLFIVGKLSEALFYAHHLGVIHRDIKPENVLFDAQGTPKLTDWGLGKVLLETSKSVSGFKGTLAYSAPEQLSATKFGAADWRTDIYQIGAMLWEMLTGKLLLGGELGRILSEEAPPPSQESATIPREADELVLRAVAKRKEDRYQDSSLIGEDIKRLQRSLKK